MDVYVIEIHYTHFAITSIPICSCMCASVAQRYNMQVFIHGRMQHIIYLDNPQAILCNHGH